MVALGYDNGDVKLFDIKKKLLLWDTNLKNGVCHIEFDRKEAEINKLGVATLESKFHIFDLKTHNVKLGFPGISEVAHNSTIWGVKHLPQNRDLFLTLGGNGGLNLYKYNYPNQRTVIDEDGSEKGVIGSLELLNSKEITTQPVVSLDWHQDKLGLAGLVALDQTVKIYLFTRLNLY